MFNNTISLTPQDLTTAMHDLWNVFLIALFLLASFIPAVIITITTASLTGLLLHLERRDLGELACDWTLLTGLFGHLFAIAISHLYYVNSDPYPGWPMMMLWIYFGEILFNGAPVVVVAIGAGIKAMVGCVWRRGVKGCGMERGESASTGVEETEKSPLLG
ncbi:uncharacterized protein MYCFIDRAFT_197309 [Pseudocercospora fijiensis CIRAD86]|uniref:Uncharacterized protein n=1 Tax=Pseudocercospora fijiensis (strain CIRAD86) TaxID=383855 RepID=M3AX87_PSEFD|nr:uncharacterized protein MYCFIDRAFT_197309 [Pseudocercospora fijiensis CIRAD86]EME82087.1 hypothetical protein MYCFIDRAFT_197309 [Pseudocercospora fijiensis CIRAD86]